MTYLREAVLARYSRYDSTVEPVWATTLPFHEKVVAVDRWSPLAVKIYSKNDVGAAKKSGREGRWSPLAGGRLYRVHCILLGGLQKWYTHSFQGFQTPAPPPPIREDLSTQNVINVNNGSGADD